VTVPDAGRTVRLIVVSAAIWVLAGAVCIGLDRYGKSARHLGTVQTVGVSGIEPVLVDTPENAYRFWREKGFHGRTILYVASGWERIDPDEFSIEDPRRAYPLKVYRQADQIEENFLDARTFLYVAAMQGIARRVIAVVSPAAFDEAKVLARRAKNARITADAVFVTYHGFPRWFTTLAQLPSPDEPVLLFVGASAFRDHGPDEVLAMLRKKGVRTDAAILCAMPGDGAVTDKERRDLADFARLLARGGA